MDDSPAAIREAAKYYRINLQKDAARRVINGLFNLSVWFEFTPMPEDTYEITLKRTDLPQYNRVLRAIGEGIL